MRSARSSGYLSNTKPMLAFFFEMLKGQQTVWVALAKNKAGAQAQTNLSNTTLVANTRSSVSNLNANHPESILNMPRLGPNQYTKSYLRKYSVGAAVASNEMIFGQRIPFNFYLSSKLSIILRRMGSANRALMLSSHIAPNRIYKYCQWLKGHKTYFGSCNFLFRKVPTITIKINERFSAKNTLKHPPNKELSHSEKNLLHMLPTIDRDICTGDKRGFVRRQIRA